MLPAPPLLPFRRLQRLSPPDRSPDVAIRPAGSGVHAVFPRDLSTAPALRHALPFEGFPSRTASPLSHRPPGWLESGFTFGASPLVVASPPSPLRGLSCVSTRQAAVRGQRPSTSGCCAMRKSVAFIASSDEAPDPPVGFSPVWVGEVVRSRPRGAELRARGAIRARVHPTSRSTASRILLTPSVLSHPRSTPATNALRREPPFAVPLREESARVRFGGGLCRSLTPGGSRRADIPTSSRCRRGTPEGPLCGGLVSFFSRFLPVSGEHPERCAPAASPEGEHLAHSMLVAADHRWSRPLSPESSGCCLPTPPVPPSS